MREWIGAQRYRVTAVLGSGGTATVYRCLDTRLGVERAVKCLNADAARKGLEARLETEARLMARVRHPNILTIHDVGTEDGVPFVVMELAERGSVADRIQRMGPLPPRQAAFVTCAVLSALAEAHRNGVVHRDVKPQNVVLTSLGVPMLMDFGIASVKDESTFGMTQTGTQLGTLAYMSPEQRIDPRKADPRSDVYATAATLCVLLTLRNPVDLHSLDAQGPLLEGVPTPLANVIARGARYRAADRYPSAEAMLEDLRAAMKDLPPDPADTAPLDVALPPAIAPTYTGADATRDDWSSHGDPTTGTPRSPPRPPPRSTPPTPPPPPPVRLAPEEIEVESTRRPGWWWAPPALAVAAALVWGVYRPSPEAVVTVESADVPAAVEAPAAQAAPDVPRATEEEPPLPPVPKVPEAEERPKAPPDVAAPPPETPPDPVPELPAGSAAITLAGDARSVVLVDLAGRRRPASGVIPVGRYRVEADFGSGPVDAGRIEPAEGAAVRLTCQRTFLRCTATTP